MFNVRTSSQLSFTTKTALAATFILLTGCNAHFYPADGSKEATAETITVPIVVTGPKTCDASDMQCNSQNYITHGLNFQFSKLVEPGYRGIPDARVTLRNSDDFSGDSWTVAMNSPHHPPGNIDVRFWQASFASPGTYTFRVNPPSSLYVKNIQSGTTNLMTENFVVHPDVTPPPIEVVLGEGAVVKGATSENGKPVAARIFDILENGERSVTSLNPPHPQGKDVFQLEGLAPGKHLLCALNLADTEKLHDTLYNRGIPGFCHKVGVSITVREAEIRHLNLEVHDVHAADLSPNASN